ncbi:MAG: hypothetical protein FJ253_12460, partial [Phycisphaerae bacterium]|nr:hypothetical protein [Phycisphaerae bacterium]
SERFEFEGAAAPGASIGVIAPVTRSFCGACSRLRITADGRVRPCLFSLEETELMDLLRHGEGAEARDARDSGAPRHERAERALDARVARVLVRERLLDAVWSKQAGHGIREPGFRQPERTMSAIGG